MCTILHCPVCVCVRARIQCMCKSAPKPIGIYMHTIVESSVVHAHCTPCILCASTLQVSAMGLGDERSSTIHVFGMCA